MKKCIFPFYILIAFCLLSNCTTSTTEKVTIDLQGIPDSVSLFAEGVVSTPLNERDMAISPGGDELFYSIFSFDNQVRILMHMENKNGVWSRPEVAPFAGKYYDLEPCFSPDGKRLYFVSNRPLSSEDSTEDHNIWYVEKSAGTWSDPVPLPEIINTEAEEFYPSVAANGNLYFTGSYADALGGEDIYMSAYNEGNYSKPVPLDAAVNSIRFEFNACISPDEKLLVFSSFSREDGLGGGDLYFAIRDSSGNWLPAINPGNLINSTRLDYCPFIDWENNGFYFTSNRGPEKPDSITSLAEMNRLAQETVNGMGNIYRVNLETILENLQ